MEVAFLGVAQLMNVSFHFSVFHSLSLTFCSSYKLQPFIHYEKLNKLFIHFVIVFFSI
jgi:hypothetical protein